MVMSKLTVRQYEEDPNSSSSSTSAQQCFTEYKYEYKDNHDAAGHGPMISTTQHKIHKMITNKHEMRFLSSKSRGGGSGKDIYYSYIVVPYQTIKRMAIKLFLPIGYPQSVDDSYLPYQLYDGLQGLCSYFRGVVSTSAILEASGVGDSSATALGAAMTWAIRDGMGMIFGGLFFSYIASDAFDTHVKEFRLFADVSNDLGLLVDMIAPLMPTQYILYILSISSICKTMCGMAAGATKGRISQHFAIHGNMADLTAKESTQETLVSLLGMIGGIGLAHILNTNNNNNDNSEKNDEQKESTMITTTWIIFLLLTMIHVWANYKAVKLLKLTSLNRERTIVVFDSLINSIGTIIGEVNTKTNVENNHSTTITSPNNNTTLNNVLSHEEEEEIERFISIPSPNDVSESLWSSLWNQLLFPTIWLGNNIIPFDPTRYDVVSCMTVFSNYNENEDDSSFRYVIGYRPLSSSGSIPALRHRTYQLSVWLCIGATQKDELQAFLHASIINKCLEENKYEWNTSLLQSTTKVIHYLFQQNNTSKSGCDIMERLTRQGWDVNNRLYLGFSSSSSRRIQWKLNNENSGSTIDDDINYDDGYDNHHDKYKAKVV